MNVTQKEIAEYVGVSRPLVARVLNGYPGIAEGTRLRVEQAARELGYDIHSNGAARALIAKRYNKSVETGVIALTVPADFDGEPIKNVPFFAPFFEGVGAEARAHGMEICLCPIAGELPRIVAARSVDGVLALSELSHVPALRAMNLPVVGLDMYSDEISHLVPADREGMRQATQHLIDLGHKRIAYIGHEPTFDSAVERFAGFKSALLDNGIQLDENLWIADLNHGEAEHGAEALRRLLKKGQGKPGFTAVVCYHDLFAMGAIEALQKAGLRVSEDISVVGFDDVSSDYSFTPAITSVSFDRRAMGRRAVRLLCAAIKGEETKNHREVFPVELVERASTGRLN